jgi:predicted SnoaL-like aldol condensation-catalyzing enzyme
VTQNSASSRNEEEQRNLDHVLGLFCNVLVPLDADQVDRYIPPNYIQHSPMAAPGRDSLKAFLKVVRAASPTPASGCCVRSWTATM